MRTVPVAHRAVAARPVCAAHLPRAGVVFFHFSAMLFTWTQWPWLIALPVTTVLFLFLYAIYSHFTRIYNKFQLKPGEMIDGRIVSPAEAAAVAGAVYTPPDTLEASTVIRDTQGPVR